MSLCLSTPEILSGSWQPGANEGDANITLKPNIEPGKPSLVQSTFQITAVTRPLVRAAALDSEVAFRT